MKTKEYLRNEWPKIKQELFKVSHEAFKLAHKGEIELRKVSRHGKLQFDLAALTLKKEHLFFLIGQEYAKANCPPPHGAKMAKLVKEFRKCDKEINSVTRLIKGKGSR